MKVDVLVVGAGFAGSIVAERAAATGKQVLVVDKRPHIAGNAYDEYDEQGILIHRYGPHIFHTNSDAVVSYLSRFTGWRPYEHKVLASVGGVLYPIPINQTTVNKLYGLDLDEAGVEKFFESVRTKVDTVRTSEDLVLSSVGPDLCDKFFRGYTKKQWGLDLSELNSSVAARVPVRTNKDDRYFTDSFQKMPSEGYTKMFERILASPNISLELGTSFQEVRHRVKWEYLVFSGPIDEYFDYKFGVLPYRSLRFDHERIAGDASFAFQPVGTVNYPNDYDYTRITEFKHLTGQIHPGTSIVREYPQNTGEPYYPVPTPENQARAAFYKEAAKAEQNVIFVGRLAQYQYYNMDQVTAAALKTASTYWG